MIVVRPLTLRRVRRGDQVCVTFWGSMTRARCDRGRSAKTAGPLAKPDHGGRRTGLRRGCPRAQGRRVPSSPTSTTVLVMMSLLVPHLDPLPIDGLVRSEFGRREREDSRAATNSRVDEDLLVQSLEGSRGPRRHRGPSCWGHCWCKRAAGVRPPVLSRTGPAPAGRRPVEHHAWRDIRVRDASHRPDARPAGRPRSRSLHMENRPNSNPTGVNARTDSCLLDDPRPDRLCPRSARASLTGWSATRSRGRAGTAPAPGEPEHRPWSYPPGWSYPPREDQRRSREARRRAGLGRARGGRVRRDQRRCGPEERAGLPARSALIVRVDYRSADRLVDALARRSGALAP
jgi:hypothetical protein